VHRSFFQIIKKAFGVSFALLHIVCIFLFFFKNTITTTSFFGRRKTMKRFSMIGLLFVLSLGFCMTSAQKAFALTLKFGVNASDTPQEVHRKFNPVLKSIAKEMSKVLRKKVRIKIKIAREYEGAVDMLADGRVDFARLGPASYVIAKGKTPSLQILALEQRNGGKVFYGNIIVGADSSIQKIQDLRGKRFAFGDQDSTIGRYLSQKYLMENGICGKDLASFQYTGRHSLVYSAVAKGEADAGALKESVVKKRAKDGMVRVLVEFPNVTKPWIARSGATDATFRALKKVLLGLKNPKVLRKLGEGFLPGTDEDFEPIRKAMAMAKDFQNCSDK